MIPPSARPQIVQRPQGRNSSLDPFQGTSEGGTVPEIAIGDRCLLGRELLMERTVDGPDFTRLCLRHQWASLPFYTLQGLPPVCPECAAEIDGGRGRERYRQLATALGI